MSVYWNHSSLQIQQKNNEQQQLEKSNRNEKHNKHDEEKEHLHDETYSEDEQHPYKLNRNHFNKLPDEII